MRPLLCSFFLLLFASIVQAQGVRLTGEVVGNADMPVMGAGVELLKESTKEKKAAFTDMHGRFSIESVQKGRYLIRISALGYTNYLAAIDISDNFYLGRINIADTSYRMAEVRISGSIIPLRQSNDTTTYDAQAYKSFADADAYYLLNKMPGFKMLGDKVLVDGDSVSKLLLNGGDTVQ